jgi:hypothetical protein
MHIHRAQWRATRGVCLPPKTPKAPLKRPWLQRVWLGADCGDRCPPPSPYLLCPVKAGSGLSAVSSGFPLEFPAGQPLGHWPGSRPSLVQQAFWQQRWGQWCTRMRARLPVPALGPLGTAETFCLHLSLQGSHKLYSEIQPLNPAGVDRFKGFIRLLWEFYVWGFLFVCFGFLFVCVCVFFLP